MDGTNQAIPLLFGWGVVLFVSGLIIATGLSGIPLDQLGLRPRGNGLFSWLLNSYVGEAVGVRGYDCIQGAMAPPLRLQFHFAFLFVFWSLLCRIVSDDVSLSKEACIGHLPISVWWCGAIALSAYASAMLFIHHVMDGVSTPGGPRESKIRRHPSWKDQTFPLNDIPKEYQCLVADKSHQYTEDKFGKKLTGEPAGRQIWNTSTATKEGENIVQCLWKHVSGGNEREDQIQAMAQGGRSYSGFNPSKNPNSCDMIFRAQMIRNYLDREGTELPSTKERPKTVQEAARKAAHFYSMLQCDDGHWAGDYGGPHFLMPGLVIAWYVMGKPKQFLDDNQIQLLLRYILLHQQSDGGWGTHIESPSTMFGSVLMYVSMRLLGIERDHPAAVEGREFIKAHGGALYTASWSKFYLCILGVMDWKGHNSVPPEMWLLPNWCPFHPGRMWCHARMVYLPMGYLYGNRFVYPKCESDATVLSLREELYCEHYKTIPWVKTRHWVSDLDNYSPLPLVMKTIQNILARYENWSIFAPFRDYVRAKGIQFSLDYIHAEDLQTNYIE